MALLQALLSGLSVGCIYGLIALGFVLIYKATESVNFAQGDLMMVAALTAQSLIAVHGMSYWSAAAVTLCFMLVLGYCLDAWVVRRLIGKPQFAIVMLTFGIGAVLRAIAGWIWGYEPLSFASPFSSGAWNMGGVLITYDSFAMIGGTVLLCLALWVFFRFSRVGLLIQAASQNQLAAYYSGLDVRRVSSIVWALAAAISGVAGILIAPVSLADPNMGFMAIKAFAAAVMGGMGSIPGALVGGLLVGLIEQFGGLLLPHDLQEPAVFAGMFLVLILRPSGIFSQAFAKKV